MAIHKTDYAKGLKNMPIPAGSEVVAVRMALTLPDTLAANDIVELGFLPEDCVPVDFYMDYDDLDTGTPQIVFDVGLLNTAEDGISTATADGGDEWMDGVTIGQAAGFTRATTSAFARVTPAAAPRKIGAECMVVAATEAAGVFAMTLLYRASHRGA